MGVFSLIAHFALLSGTKVNVRDAASAKISIQDLVGFENVAAVKETAAQELLEKIQCVDVPMPTSIAEEGKVTTTFAKFSSSSSSSSSATKRSGNLLDQFMEGLEGLGQSSGSSGKSKSSGTPVIMLHGFDSSCLEFRRIAPLLAEKGVGDIYIPDILGWGFNPPVQEVKEYTPEAKIKHLVSFINIVGGGRPVHVVGASLGGGVALTLAAEYPELVSKLILIDAQGFIDGDGPKDLPDPLARFGVNVLKSTPLRMFANYIAYKEKSFATLDAMRVGRLHCLLPTWEDASVSFLLSGGFVFSDKVKRVTQETLVMWGEGDEILEPSTVDKFKEALPDCQVAWFPSGHVPHLETPREAADAIVDFL